MEELGSMKGVSIEPPRRKVIMFKTGFFVLFFMDKFLNSLDMRGTPNVVIKGFKNCFESLV